MSSEALRRGFNNVKGGIIRGYHTTKNVLGTINNAVNVGKQIYGVLAPVIDQYGGSQINQNIMKGIGNYEQVRHKILNYQNEAETIGNKLSRIKI
jgi:hypothetical protein